MPFSFVGADRRRPGYSIDLCRQVVGALQQSLGLPKIQIKWVGVTSESRITAVAGGSVDLECGSTTHTLSRQEQVDFSLTTFVDGGSLLVTTASGIKGAGDLAGKRLAVIAGTTTERALADWFRANNVSGAKVLNVKEHVDGLAGLDSGAFDAFASDRVILFGLAANSKDADQADAAAGVLLLRAVRARAAARRPGLSPRRRPGARRALSLARRHPDLREVVRLHQPGHEHHPGHVPPERAPGVTL